MSFAKLVVPLNGSPKDAVALQTAFAAAKPFNAHVRAVFISPDARLMIPYSGPPVSPEVVESIIAANEELARDASKSARETLATSADAADIRLVARPECTGTVTASYVERTGLVADCLEQGSIFADAVVFPELGHGDNPELYDAFVRVLTRAHRPALLSAKAAPNALGLSIGVAWDGGFAAARAISAALPFLHEAHSVQLFTVTRARGAQNRIDAAKSYLALHGISCSATSVDPEGHEVSDVLMDTASVASCDLLVMGGYGHNRLVETIFGGVTQRVASHPKLPVFMLH